MKASGGRAKQHVYKRARTGRSSGSKSSAAASGSNAPKRSRHNRGSTTQDTTPPIQLHDLLSCDACKEPISMSSDHIKLSPCEHKLCTCCAITAFIQRGIKYITCPVGGCKSDDANADAATQKRHLTTSCKYYSARVEKKVIANPSVGHAGFTRQYLPLEYLNETCLSKVKEDETRTGVVLYGASFGNGVKRPIIHCQSLVLETKHNLNNPHDIYDKTMLKKLMKYFQFLHTIVPRNSITPKSLVPVMSARELMEFRLSYPLPMDAALFALSTGSSDFNEQKVLAKDYPEYQSNFLASISSADILLRCLTDYPTYFQLMLMEIVSRNMVSKQFLDTLSAYRLAPSRGFSLKQRSLAVIKSIRSGTVINSRDFVVLLFDNIGFKILGKNASYDQWTIFHIVVVPETTLKAMGFYQDKAEMKDRISRERNNDWLNEIEDDERYNQLADDIVLPKRYDFDLKHISQLQTIDLALLIASDVQTEDPHVLKLGYKFPRTNRIIDKETKDAIDDKIAAAAANTTTYVPLPTPTYIINQPLMIPRTFAPRDYEDEIGGNESSVPSDRAVDDYIEDNSDSEHGTEKKPSASSQYAQNNSFLEVSVNPSKQNMTATSRRHKNNAAIFYNILCLYYRMMYGQ